MTAEEREAVRDEIAAEVVSFDWYSVNTHGDEQEAAEAIGVALDRYAKAVAAPLVTLLRSCERELWLGGSVVQMRERIRATLEAYEEAAR